MARPALAQAGALVGGRNLPDLARTKSRALPLGELKVRAMVETPAEGPKSK